MVSYLISVEVDTKQLEKKFGKLQARLPGVMKNIVSEGLEFINNKAMENLNNDIIWGHNLDPDLRIANSKVIEIPIVTPTKVLGSLSYTSEHALITEIGGLVATTITKDTGSWPIGQSQYGSPVAFSPTFHLQEGKWFLSRAVWGNLDGIYDIARKNVDELISSL
jgi:hypothetical protein